MAGAVGFSMFFSSINVYAADNTNNEKRPKYVFYFIGDGMGFSHIALTEASNSFDISLSVSVLGMVSPFFQRDTAWLVFIDPLP